MIFERHKWLSFMPAVLVAAGIAVLSLWEQPAVPMKIVLNDKLVHGVMYAVLAISLMAAFVVIGRTRAKHYVLVCAYAILYGLFMEALQRFCTFSRSGEMADLIADFIGALIGIGVVALWQQFTTSR